jgi:integrase
VTGFICVLDGGRRVRFFLKRRDRDPKFHACFRGPDGKRRELSTREKNRKAAFEVAVSLIRRCFAEWAIPNTVLWDDAARIIEQHMVAANLRRTTIDDYLIVLKLLRRSFPEMDGPAAITPAMAEQFKIQRINQGRSIDTIRGDLNALCVLYNRWLIKATKLLDVNPFADVILPKTNRRTPRLVQQNELQSFLDWLDQRWNGWRLPTLFLEVKAAIGCRIRELASTRTSQLKDGRIHFDAETTKGRKTRMVRLPKSLYAELVQNAGKEFVFERFESDRRKVHRKRGSTKYASLVKPFSPTILIHWLQAEKLAYFAENPNATRFKLHNLRGTAMSKARMLGVTYDDAAIAFGCNPETMRRHYLALNEVDITDRVMERLHGSNNGSPKPTEPPTPPSP